MAKLLLLSIIFATIALPARAARMKNPKLGLKKTLLWLVVFNLVYVFSLVYIFGRL
jgi:hypothetical protein